MEDWREEHNEGFSGDKPDSSSRNLSRISANDGNSISVAGEERPLCGGNGKKSIRGEI